MNEFVLLVHILLWVLGVYVYLYYINFQPTSLSPVAQTAQKTLQTGLLQLPQELSPSNEITFSREIEAHTISEASQQTETEQSASRQVALHLTHKHVHSHANRLDREAIVLAWLFYAYPGTDILTNIWFVLVLAMKEGVRSPLLLWGVRYEVRLSCGFLLCFSCYGLWLLSHFIHLALCFVLSSPDNWIQKHKMSCFIVQSTQTIQQEGVDIPRVVASQSPLLSVWQCSRKEKI